jgi:hypothetical protein
LNRQQSLLDCICSWAHMFSFVYSSALFYVTPKPPPPPKKNPSHYKHFTKLTRQTLQSNSITMPLVCHHYCTEVGVTVNLNYYFCFNIIHISCNYIIFTKVQYSIYSIEYSFIVYIQHTNYLIPKLSMHEGRSKYSWLDTTYR